MVLILYKEPSGILSILTDLLRTALYIRMLSFRKVVYQPDYDAGPYQRHNDLPNESAPVDTDHSQHRISHNASDNAENNISHHSPFAVHDLPCKPAGNSSDQQSYDKYFIKIAGFGRKTESFFDKVFIDFSPPLIYNNKDMQFILCILIKNKNWQIYTFYK